MPSFGERLRELRIKKNITQQELANLVNVDRSTVSKWERDQSIPTILDAEKIAEALGISVYDLIESRSEEKTSPETKPEPVTDYMIFFLLCVISVISIPIGSVTSLIAVIYSFWKKLPTILKVLGIMLWLGFLRKLYYYLGLHHLL